MKHLSAAIAWRYLFSKKSHGAVGTISMVSLCAMSVATAAIICVLSVFNGFKQVIGDKLDTLSPDVMVTPAKGKVFADGEALAARLDSLPEVAIATPTLSDNALLICNSQEMPVKVKGVVAEDYERVTAARQLIPKEFGEYFSGNDAEETHGEFGEPWEAVLSVGTASRLKAYPGYGALIFAPKREGRLNMANPAASFLTDSMIAKGIYRTDQQQFDEDGVMIPLQLARNLFQYDREASAVELRLNKGIDAARTAEKISQLLGPEYEVKDRLRQQEMNFRMIEIEKWVSFLLLVFILVIAGFNIISALSMLVLEKDEAIDTFRSLGMSRKRIGAVFAWESIYVSAAGGIIGILLGIALCLLQQHFGLIKIGGDPEAAIVHAYPVVVNPTDILITLIPVAALGLITAAISAAFARSRLGLSKTNCQ